MSERKSCPREVAGKQVLALLALLVQTYLLYWYRSTKEARKEKEKGNEQGEEGPGEVGGRQVLLHYLLYWYKNAWFTCFDGTKVVVQREEGSE